MQSAIASFSIAGLLGVVGCASTHATSDAGNPLDGSNDAAIDPVSGIGVAAEVTGGPTYQSLEGPIWVASLGVVLFSDVIEMNATGAEVASFDPSANAFGTFAYPGSPITTNGLAWDDQGRLWACERANGDVARVNGSQRDVIESMYQGTHLGAPNDIVLRGDGNVYFSDAMWGSQTPAATPSVYRIAPNGALTRIFETVPPNGVALSPDGSTLYIGSDVQPSLYRMTLDATGAPSGSAERIIAPGDVPNGALQTPDGICIDDAGNLYVAANSTNVHALLVFAVNGTYRGRIDLPAGIAPSNCTFGDADRRTLYITTAHALYRVRANLPGLP